MSVRIEPVPGALNVPDTADELVTDVPWLAACDQVRAAVRRATLPVYSGWVSTELAAEQFGSAR